MATAANLTEKTFFVTGATGALGRATATLLARRGARVVMVSLDASKGRTLLDAVRRTTGTESTELLVADLSDPSSVRAAARGFSSRHEVLHGLVHTAAVYTRKRSVTADGHERMFETNHLGPFLLTNLLLDRLRSGSPSRVVTVTAPTTSKLDFDDLQGERTFRPLSAFGRSKMANLLFAYELARRLEGTGVTSNAVHPGLMKSDLIREAPAAIRFVVRLASRPPERAAEAIVHLLASPDLGGVTGRFFKRTKLAESHPYSRNREIQKRLWEVSEQLVGESFPLPDR